jgi:hypothetical protein
MYASSSVDLRQGRPAAPIGSGRPAGTIRRLSVHIFAFAVEAILVIGLIVVTLAPDGGSRPGTGPDRPPAPLESPLRP